VLQALHSGAAKKDVCTMKQYLGMGLQLLALGALPTIIVFQLLFGFRLIVMPVSLLIGTAVFWIGTLLRESR
jgi:hypothetical protein